MIRCFLIIIVYNIVVVNCLLVLLALYAAVSGLLLDPIQVTRHPMSAPGKYIARGFFFIYNFFSIEKKCFIAYDIIINFIYSRNYWYFIFDLIAVYLLVYRTENLYKRVKQCPIAEALRTMLWTDVTIRKIYYWYGFKRNLISFCQIMEFLNEVKYSSEIKKKSDVRVLRTATSWNESISCIHII